MTTSISEPADSSDEYPPAKSSSLPQTATYFVGLSAFLLFAEYINMIIRIINNPWKIIKIPVEYNIFIRIPVNNIP